MTAVVKHYCDGCGIEIAAALVCAELRINVTRSGDTEPKRYDSVGEFCDVVCMRVGFSKFTQNAVRGT